MRVTTDDLLDALRDALTVKPGDDAPTSLELQAATGLAERKLRRALAAVQAEGRLEVVMVRRVDLAGRVQSVPGYRLKKAKRAA